MGDLEKWTTKQPSPSKRAQKVSSKSAGSFSAPQLCVPRDSQERKNKNKNKKEEAKIKLCFVICPFSVMS